MARESVIEIEKSEVERLAEYFNSEYEKYADMLSEKIEEKYPHISVLTTDEGMNFDVYLNGDIRTQEDMDKLELEEFEWIKRQMLREATAYMIMLSLMEINEKPSLNFPQNTFDLVKYFYGATNLGYHGF